MNCNVGYALVNCISPLECSILTEQFRNHPWPNSDLNCEIIYADIQGLESLKSKYKNSAVVHQEIQNHPKCFHTSGPQIGLEAPFYQVK